MAEPVLLLGINIVFRIAALIASVIALCLTVLLSTHGKTYGLSYVALTIASLSNTPLFFDLFSKRNVLEQLPPILRALGNLIVAGLVLTSGIVFATSLINDTHLILEEDRHLISAGADVSFLLSALFIALAILDCIQQFKDRTGERDRFEDSYGDTRIS